MLRAVTAAQRTVALNQTVRRRVENIRSGREPVLDGAEFMGTGTGSAPNVCGRTVEASNRGRASS